MEELNVNRMPLIGDDAPAFKAKTTQGEMGDFIQLSCRFYPQIGGRVMT